jgi:hypothetical protein
MSVIAVPLLERDAESLASAKILPSQAWPIGPAQALFIPNIDIKIDSMGILCRPQALAWSSSRGPVTLATTPEAGRGHRLPFTNRSSQSAVIEQRIPSLQVDK